MLGEGHPHAVCHGVVEVRHRLPAVLVVLIGLNRNARKRGEGADVFRRTQEAVPRAEPAREQIHEVDLATGHGETVEIEIVNVDVALLVRTGDVGAEHVVDVELLGALGAELQHGAHSRVAIDIRILALDV